MTSRRNATQSRTLAPGAKQLRASWIRARVARPPAPATTRHVSPRVIVDTEKIALGPRRKRSYAVDRIIRVVIFHCPSYPSDPSGLPYYFRITLADSPFTS